jgi:dUTP pyrophosphatase
MNKNGLEKYVKVVFAGKNETVKIPSKRTEDAAIDIYANFPEDYVIIEPHEMKMISTGLYSAFSSDWCFILYERGSTGVQNMGKRAGVIDSGFRGEWFVGISNHSNSYLVIAKEYVTDNDIASVIGEKPYRKYSYSKAICQALLIPVPKIEIVEMSVEDLQKIPSERGIGILGSSNK